MKDLDQINLDRLSALADGAPDWPGLAQVAGDRLTAGGAWEAILDQLQGQLVYLATPYSRVVVDGEGLFSYEASLKAIYDAAGWSGILAVEGVTSLSPIIQSAEMVHTLGSEFLDPLDAAFWTRWCVPLLAASDAVVIPPIPGWDSSVGVWGEACRGVEMGIPVIVLDGVA